MFVCSISSVNVVYLCQSAEVVRTRTGRGSTTGTLIHLLHFFGSAYYVHLTPTLQPQSDVFCHSCRRNLGFERITSVIEIASGLKSPYKGDKIHTSSL